MPEMPTRIGIAVVVSDGRVLVGTRPSDVPEPNKHEFPGGKAEGKESGRSAAVRECEEETGIAVKPVGQIYQCRKKTDGGAIELHFWLCNPTDAKATEPENGYSWISMPEVFTLDFPDANEPVLNLLKVLPEDAGAGH